MPTGEIIHEWERIQKETQEDNSNLNEKITTFLTTGRIEESCVDRWTEANEIRTEELDFIGRKLGRSASVLSRQGLPAEELISAMFSAGFQLGFNVANARIGADL